MKFLLFFFRKPTFASITAGLQKTIEKLESLAVKNDEAAAAKQEAINRHQNEIGVLIMERHRSTTVAAKLKDLLTA